jgi:hypothetical protein
MVLVKDKLYFAMGNGVSTVLECEKYFLQKRFKSLPDIDAKVREIYRRLDTRMRVSQVKEFLYPPLWQEAFIRMKPDNFSLMEGEDLPLNSPLLEEWERALDDSSLWYRVHDNREEGDSKRVDEKRKLGNKQEDLVGGHSHLIDRRFLTITESKRVDYIIWGKETRALIGLSKSTVVTSLWQSEENRPWSLSVFRLQKTAPRVS